jgi:hypothetical protein
MATPKTPADPAELRDRIARYGADWSASILSTERADRPRAEAAIRVLYRNAGLTEPMVTWVPSPAAGVEAYGVVSRTHAEVSGAYARGDIGTGNGRTWRALGQPFDIEPGWAARMARRSADRVAGAMGGTPSPRPWDWNPVAEAARGLGIADMAGMMASIRTALAAEPLRAPKAKHPDPEPDPEGIDAVAGSLLGGQWTRLTGLLGASLAREVFATATRQAADRMLPDSQTRREAVQAMQPGQFDVTTPVLAAGRDAFGGELWNRRATRDAHVALIDARLELARSAGPWWALEGVAIISERPVAIHRDDRSRPHSESGPAIAYGDGFRAWVWHGVAVDEDIILAPERITVRSIDAERNTERRRVLVERFGEERLLREGGGKIIDEGPIGRLWSRPAPQIGWPRDEPIVMVEVQNSTPEPDGTRRTYLLRVPPTMKTAHEAVAWTFGLSFDAYRPVVET